MKATSLPNFPQTSRVEQAPHTDLECILFAQLTQTPSQLMLLITTSIIILQIKHLLVITDHTPVLVTDVAHQWTIQTSPLKKKK